MATTRARWSWAERFPIAALSASSSEGAGVELAGISSLGEANSDASSVEAGSPGATGTGSGDLAGSGGAGAGGGPFGIAGGEKDVTGPSGPVQSVRASASGSVEDAPQALGRLRIILTIGPCQGN